MKPQGHASIGGEDVRVLLLHCTGVHATAHAMDTLARALSVHAGTQPERARGFAAD